MTTPETNSVSQKKNGTQNEHGYVFEKYEVVEAIPVFAIGEPF
jgi:hypothetical protein